MVIRLTLEMWLASFGVSHLIGKWLNLSNSFWPLNLPQSRLPTLQGICSHPEQVTEALPSHTLVFHKHSLCMWLTLSHRPSDSPGDRIPKVCIRCMERCFPHAIFMFWNDTLAITRLQAGGLLHHITFAGLVT